MTTDDEDITLNSLNSLVRQNNRDISELSNAVKELRKENAEQRKENEPIHEFFQDMATAARLGRALRFIVSWCVTVGGVVMVVYLVVSDAVTGKS